MNKDSNIIIYQYQHLERNGKGILVLHSESEIKNKVWEYPYKCKHCQQVKYCYILCKYGVNNWF